MNSHQRAAGFRAQCDYVKWSDQGSRPGPPFIVRHLSEALTVAVDNFAAEEEGATVNRRILGLDRTAAP